MLNRPRRLGRQGRKVEDRMQEYCPLPSNGFGQGWLFICRVVQMKNLLPPLAPLAP